MEEEDTTAMLEKEDLEEKRDMRWYLGQKSHHQC